MSRSSDEESGTRFSPAIDNKTEAGYNHTTDTEGGEQDGARLEQEDTMRGYFGSNDRDGSFKGSDKVGWKTTGEKEKIRSGSGSAETVPSPGQTAEQRRIRAENKNDFGVGTYFFKN
ncbi:MAG: hypothetical protein ACI3XP_04005 [Eubacteriales bacterium]